MLIVDLLLASPDERDIPLTEGLFDVVSEGFQFVPSRLLLIKPPLAGLNEQDIALFERGVGLRTEAFKLVANRLLFAFKPVNIGQPNVALGGKFSGFLLALLFHDCQRLLAFAVLLFN
ncbi:MAG: hypothetical protein ORN25_05430, partial [Caulobacteraceae bacterium]|nr:hypothetical protein [Caulobacteraceae bacterium]